MSEPPEPPPLADRYATATGKGDIQVPGAGNIGMALLLVSLSILFIASMAAYLIIRMQSADRWPPPGFPRVPNSLWISTIVLVCSSLTIEKAIAAIRRNDEKTLARYLLITFAIGVLFLLLQIFNWWEFYSEIRTKARLEGAYLGMFFVLTGLHAAHVLGGLIPLAIVHARAKKGRYSSNFYPGVRYVSVYWHFLDIIWLVLFAVLYF